MEISDKIKRRADDSINDVVYRDVGALTDLGNRIVGAVHAYCFCHDKLVLVYSDKKGYWAPPGGKVESGESVEEAVIREVKEETNMRVISQKLIGYQDIFAKDKVETQTRSVCIVEPYDDFVSDPDGDITKIILINPADYKQYFDWAKIGDHVWQRAVEMKSTL